MEKLVIQVCVGSSCHLKGSLEIVELFGMTEETFDKLFAEKVLSRV